MTHTPMLVTRTNGTQQCVCCGRGVAVIRDVFGYMPIYDARQEGDCPNHPALVSVGRAAIIAREVEALHVRIGAPINRRDRR